MRSGLRNGGCEEQEPRTRRRRSRARDNPKEHEEEQPAPWLSYANRVLDDPLPLHPTDAEGYAAMRWLLYHAMDMHLEQNYEWEQWYLQALNFVTQHYASVAHHRLKAQALVS